MRIRFPEAITRWDTSGTTVLRQPVVAKGEKACRMADHQWMAASDLACIYCGAVK